MFSNLKNHPFAVEAFFDQSLVLTFAVPRSQLEPLIPECLSVDSFHDQWGFIAVAIVQTRNLRPKGFPSFFGNDFILVGYRIFVNYINKEGKRLRGLYILKSQTDKKQMELVGNIFTHYKYSTTDISLQEKDNILTIDSSSSGFKLIVDNSGQPTLPEQSPFTEWKEARRFAGPLPFTFTYNSGTKEVLIIEGVRQHWDPQPVRILEYDFPFLKTLPIENPVLANAFVIKNIPYHWKKGKIEQWSQ